MKWSSDEGEIFSCTHRRRVESIAYPTGKKFKQEFYGRHQVRIFIRQERKETGILWKTFGSQIITSFGGKI